MHFKYWIQVIAKSFASDGCLWCQIRPSKSDSFVPYTLPASARLVRAAKSAGLHAVFWIGDHPEAALAATGIGIGIGIGLSVPFLPAQVLISISVALVPILTAFQLERLQF